MKRGTSWRVLGMLLSISMLAGGGCADTESQEAEPFSGLTLIPPNRTVERGDTFQLAATRVENGEATNVTQGTTWTVSDPSIAQVNSQGQLTANKPGTVRITAQADGLSATTAVYVLGRPVDVQLSPALVRIAPGTSTSLATTVISEDNTKRALSGDEAWASSTPSTASVNGSTVQGTQAGESLITLSNRGRAYFKRVQVLDVDLSTVAFAVSPRSSIVAGQGAALIATGRFTSHSGASEPVEHEQDVSNYFSYELATEADAEFVSVSGSSVTALKPGRAVIKATGLANTIAQGRADQLTVDVVPVPASITLDIPAKLSLQGEPLALRVNGTVGTDTYNVSSLATFRAEPAGIVSISGTTLTPLAAGEVKLTATIGTGTSAKKASATLSVVDAPFSQLAITPTGSTATVAVGRTLRLTGTATFATDMTQTVSRQVLWLSTNPSVAVVDNAGGLSGVVTGLSEGTTTIKAYYRGQEAGSKEISVTP